jgi:hypothetical protein
MASTHLVSTSLGASAVVPLREGRMHENAGGEPESRRCDAVAERRGYFTRYRRRLDSAQARAMRSGSQPVRVGLFTSSCVTRSFSVARLVARESIGRESERSHCRGGRRAEWNDSECPLDVDARLASLIGRRPQCGGNVLERSPRRFQNSRRTFSLHSHRALARFIFVQRTTHESGIARSSFRGPFPLPR